MEKIHLNNGLSENDIDLILDWTNSKDAEFLRQFAGEKWSYPLTKKQIQNESGSIYSIFQDDKFVGMIQVISKENDNAHIGRFLLNPNETGKGIGTTALKLFCKQLFDSDIELKSITLNVREVNKAAQRCYAKCGFMVSKEFWENGKVARMQMRLKR